MKLPACNLHLQNPRTNKSKRRLPSGNVLVLVMVTSGVCALILTTFFSFGTVIFAETHLQNILDNVALSGACALNSNDCQGQMNNMVVRCRQLVYASRQTDDTIAQQRPLLSKLADQLLEEARTSATTVEQERANLMTTSTAQAQQTVTTKFKSACGQQSQLLCLPWLQVSSPTLVSTSFGTVTGVDSNAFVLNGLPQLAAFDQQQSYIDSAPGLYKPGINAKLPAKDGDLIFDISSLPAYVKNITAPACLLGSGSFTNQSDNQLKSAVQVRAVVKVSTTLGCSTTQSISLVSTATTYGGAQMP